MFQAGRQGRAHHRRVRPKKREKREFSRFASGSAEFGHGVGVGKVRRVVKGLGVRVYDRSGKGGKKQEVWESMLR